MRLVDRPHPRDSRFANSFLEVLVGTTWGRVCGGSASRNFATVACRETKGQFAARIRNETDSAYFGIKYFGKFDCTGKELMGAQCTWRLTRRNSCPFGYVVLDCSNGQYTTPIAINSNTLNLAVSKHSEFKLYFL